MFLSRKKRISKIDIEYLFQTVNQLEVKLENQRASIHLLEVKNDDRYFLIEHYQSKISSFEKTFERQKEYIDSLRREFKRFVFKTENPQPYKKGDKFGGKDHLIVTDCYIEEQPYLKWIVEYFNTVTVEKSKKQL